MQPPVAAVVAAVERISMRVMALSVGAVVELVACIRQLSKPLPVNSIVASPEWRVAGPVRRRVRMVTIRQSATPVRV